MTIRPKGRPAPRSRRREQSRKPKRVREERRTRRGPDGAEVPIDAEHAGLTVHLEPPRYRYDPRDSESLGRLLAGPDPEPLFVALERWARAVLAEAGVALPDGARGWEGVLGTRETAPPHSQPWCAANALFDVHVARANLDATRQAAVGAPYRWRDGREAAVRERRYSPAERGERAAYSAGEAAFHAARAMRLYMLATMKREAEPDALKHRTANRGRKAGAPKGARARAAKYADARERLRRAARQRWEHDGRPAGSARRIAEFLAERELDPFDRSPVTIARIIRPALR